MFTFKTVGFEKEVGKLNNNNNNDKNKTHDFLGVMFSNELLFMRMLSCCFALKAPEEDTETSPSFP